MMPFAPTLDSQTPLPAHARYGSNAAVVAGAAAVAPGPGTAAARWWAGMTDEEIYQNGCDWIRFGGILPICSSPPIITPSSGLEVGSVLTASPGTWERATRLTYQWVRDGHPIVGATSPSYIVTIDDSRSHLAYLVTGTNSAGSETQVSNLSAPVAAAAPDNLTAPIITNTGLQLGAELWVSSTGAWAGNPTGFAYQWLRGGAAIPSATAINYILTAADDGAFISCLVTASNDVGASSVASNAVGPVATAAPAIQVAPEITPTIGLQVGTVLTVTSGSWSGAPTSYSYQWMRGDVPIVGQTNASYVVSAADSNATIGCLVTASNVNGSSTEAAVPVVGPVALTNLLIWNGQAMTWHSQNLTWN